MRLHEIHTKRDTVNECNRFVKWAAKKLKLASLPKITYSSDRIKVDTDRTFGTTLPSGEIWVYIGDRNTADILRTLCHELVHFKQFSDGLVTTNLSKDDHGRIEDVANAMAGRLMREYGKAHGEIFFESSTPLNPEVAATLPATYVIPELPNQDPYLQYRFAVALAGAKGKKQREIDNIQPYSHESAWGENMIISSTDSLIGEYIDDALAQMGLHGKRLISTPTSEEPKKTGTTSVAKPFKGYPR